MADPNYANVVLLAFNNNGADGTTTFTDQSSSPKTLTALGDTQWDTAQAPTGLTSSVLLDGTGDRLTTPDNADFDFGSGDFTIEAYVRFNVDPAGDQWFIAQVDSPTGTGSWGFFLRSNNLRFYYTTGGGLGTNRFPAWAWNPAASTWYHVAVCRSGANLRGFVDGTQVGSTFNSSTDTIFNGTSVLGIGGDNTGTASAALNGWIAGLRVTKGVARYTGTFTPPSLPLPTSAVDAPVADFTGTPTSGTDPVTVQFTDSSTNTPTSWLWERTSDGTNWTSFSTSQNPSQAFTAGTWGVRLTATNAGGSNTKTRTNYITVSAPVSTDTGGGGNGKKRKHLGKPKVIRRSEFASREDYEQAMRAALVSIPLSEVEIPDVIEAEDDDALLAVMLRVLH